MLKQYRRLTTHVVTALADPRRSEYAIAILLISYAVIWTLYGILARASQDVPRDAAELVAWSHHLAFGYAKHPPLGAWLVRAWFAVFPLTDWSYYLFGMIYSSIGLWFAWRLFYCFLGPIKRLTALALLTFVPVCNFFCLRFDVDAVLAPVWAATMLAFVRSFETRSVGWAALAGVAAAASMLGKYWSLFLLLGLALAALVDRRRAAYFRSSAPWVTLVVGTFFLMPHVVWLADNDFSSIRYAFNKHASGSLFQTVTDSCRYLAGSVAYMAVPTVLTLVVSRPSWCAVADALIPRDNRRRFVVISLFGPILLPLAVAFMTDSELNSIWTLAGFALLPIVLLSSPLVTVDMPAARTVVGAALTFPIIMTLVAPAIAVVHNFSSKDDAAMCGKMLADRMLIEWHKKTDKPLLLVGGALDLAYVTAFYLPDKPDSLPVTKPYLAPWVNSELIAHRGIVFVCHFLLVGEHERSCNGNVTANIAHILKGSPPAKPVKVKLRRSFLGIVGRPGYFLVFVAPPWK
jgi:4-amino-4-deoxy-L-arabinose transferase-like glycosyltransferase